MVVLSTASPFKFPRDVLAALGEAGPGQRLCRHGCADRQDRRGGPASLSVLDKLEVRFKTVLQPADIRAAALK